LKDFIEKASWAHKMYAQIHTLCWVWIEDYSTFWTAFYVLCIAKPVFRSKQPGGGLISAKQAIETAQAWEQQ